jgi:hypothetical protein
VNDSQSGLWWLLLASCAQLAPNLPSAERGVSSVSLNHRDFFFIALIPPSHLELPVVRVVKECNSLLPLAGFDRG